MPETYIEYCDGRTLAFRTGHTQTALPFCTLPFFMGSISTLLQTQYYSYLVALLTFGFSLPTSLIHTTTTNAIRRLCVPRLYFST